MLSQTAPSETPAHTAPTAPTDLEMEG
jgi:hypothetical protein